MKKLLSTFVIAIITIMNLSAQIPGSKFKGPITIFDSIKVYEEDTLFLGRGSDPRTGDFVFIYTPANYWAGTPLTYYNHQLANTTLKVKFFKEFESKKTGKKIYTVVDSPGYNAVAELESAINSGEIIAINKRNVSKPAEAKTVIINSQVSVADELRKLKQLLNDSIITQEEFDLQKKKLLEIK